MPVYSIEARSFCIALAWCHNFWVLKNDSGETLAELHGLAYDRIRQKILPIGTTRTTPTRSDGPCIRPACTGAAARTSSTRARTA